MAGTAGSSSLYRVHYDTGSSTWVREDRGGVAAGTLLYCSTKTGNSGRLFCAPGTSATGNKQTYYVDTSSSSGLANCGLLINSGSNNARGVAVDPNPNGVSGRDVVYFAHAIDTGPNYVIRKLAADCSGTIDGNYGNRNWSLFAGWNDIVGMTVDPQNGDLYVASLTEVDRVKPDETVQVVKTGFTSIKGIDVSREGASDPGLLLVADGGASNTVKAIALDNLSGTPMAVAPAANLRAASFGAMVSGGPWLAANVNRIVAINNNGDSGGVDPLRSDPLFDVLPVGPFKVWISSPSVGEAMPPGQVAVRGYGVADPPYSQANVTLQFHDGKSRFVCAWTGDPGKGAPQYDPAPLTQTDCDKPRAYATAICDNKNDISTGGPGSFTDAGDPIQSCKTCGGSTPCEWKFRISTRYGGDNYKVYFALDSSSSLFVGTSDIYTAWKHVHVEPDRMCRRGNLLAQDYGAPGECGGLNQPACCGTQGQPACTEISMYDWGAANNLLIGDSLTVFDEKRPYETSADHPVVSGIGIPAGGTVTITLDRALLHSYRASDRNPNALNEPWFSNGHSGGICVDASGYYEADTSGLRQPYDDAFVDYHISAAGQAGSGVIPFLAPFLLNSVNKFCRMSRFDSIWFGHFSPDGAIGNCALPEPQTLASASNNYFHLVGAQNEDGTSQRSAASYFLCNWLYVYSDAVAHDCTLTSAMCGPGELANMQHYYPAHETGHLFGVNNCSPPDKHDSRDAWCGSAGGACVNPTWGPEKCPMYGGNVQGQDMDFRADGIDHFCREDLILGDPNCVGNPRDGAVRTKEDPQ